MQNQRRMRSLPKGVKVSRSGRFSARLGPGGVIHIGTFYSAEEAHAAYCEAARKHFGEFWHPG
jgi:hypothetical protein